MAQLCGEQAIELGRLLSQRAFARERQPQSAAHFARKFITLGTPGDPGPHRAQTTRRPTLGGVLRLELAHKCAARPKRDNRLFCTCVHGLKRPCSPPVIRSSVAQAIASAALRHAPHVRRRVCRGLPEHCACPASTAPPHSPLPSRRRASLHCSCLDSDHPRIADRTQNDALLLAALRRRTRNE